MQIPQQGLGGSRIFELDQQGIRTVAAQIPEQSPPLGGGESLALAGAGEEADEGAARVGPPQRGQRRAGGQERAAKLNLLRRVATVGVRNGACPRGFARAAGGPTPVLEFDEVFVPGKPGCMAPWMSFADIIDRISRLQPGHLPVPTGTRLTSADIAGIRSNPLTSAQDGEVPRFSSRRWPHPSAGVRRSLRGQETLQDEPVVVLEGI